MFFKDIPGQQGIKNKLISNIKKGRVSHAQLFLGPEGCGKLTLAIAYARYLCCASPGPHDACGNCPSCLKINKLAHPDLNFFYPVVSRKQGDRTFISKDFINEWRGFLARSAYPVLNDWYNHLEIENKQGIISAEDCNEITRVLNYKSYEVEYKIVIIWMIERLYHSAAPKLLKILEEPPEKTLFLIVSENQEQILNTILSRTQMVKIPKLSDEDILHGLMQIHGIEEAVAREATFIADGNFYHALSFCLNTETQDNHTRFLRDWLRDCYTFKIKEMFTYVEDLSKMGRERQKAFLNFGLEIFRQCTLINYQARELVKAHPDVLDFVSKFSQVLQPQFATQMVEEFSKAIYHVERNANPKILFTDLSLKMGHIFMHAKK